MYTQTDFGVDKNYQIPDELWSEIQTILPPPPPTPRQSKRGRKRMSDRQAMTAVFYLLRTGIQWKALPRCLGAASTVHDRYQWWVENGLFLKLWQTALQEYDLQLGLDWEWLAADGAMTKAPLGREKKSGEIQPTVASTGLNARCWWKATGCPSPSKLKGPTGTT